MSLGMPGDVKRVGEPRYAPRVREAALNQERADEQMRLAALEDHVRGQKRLPPRDIIELKSAKPKDSAVHAAEEKTPRKKPTAPKPGEHLDVTV